jgi:hypothetical protein
MSVRLANVQTKDALARLSVCPEWGTLLDYLQEQCNTLTHTAVYSTNPDVRATDCGKAAAMTDLLETLRHVNDQPLDRSV